MREPADATIDRLCHDVARLTSEVDAVWAVLDAAGIDVQLGTDTLADGVGMLVAVRDMAIAHAENVMQAEAAIRDALTVQRDEALADAKMWGDAIGAAWDQIPDGEKAPGDTLADIVRGLVAQRTKWRGAAWASIDRGRRLNAIAAQLGGVSWDTIPEAIVAVLNERDEAIIDRDNYAAAFRAMTAALLPFTAGGSDV
jgi:hypothetical protein